MPLLGAWSLWSTGTIRAPDHSLTRDMQDLPSVSSIESGVTVKVRIDLEAAGGRGKISYFVNDVLVPIARGGCKGITRYGTDELYFAVSIMGGGAKKSATTMVSVHHC